MRPRATDTSPLTLSEQLDAMLLGWLERRADRETAQQPGLRARALVTIVERHVAELERFCERWAMTVERGASDNPTWAVLYIDGPALAIEGFSAITGMYRR